MNQERKDLIKKTFRRCQKEGKGVLLIEAAQMAGVLMVETQKNGFTTPEAIEMVKQHLLGLSEAWKDFAENHFERVAHSVKPRLKVMEGGGQ